MQAHFCTQPKETFAINFTDHYDKYGFQNSIQALDILPLQNLSSSFVFLYASSTSSDIDIMDSDFASPSSVDSDETKESLSVAKQSKKISKKKPEIGKQKVPTKRGLWSSSDDAKLVSLVEQYGEKWSQISKMMPKKGRKQIRDRYMNALRPGINWGEWTKEEENQFEILYQRFGNRWCQIAACLPGRTENQVKNKYYGKRLEQPKKNATAYRKSKGKTCAKNVKPRLKVQRKQSEETETVSENLTNDFNLLDKILLFETDTEQISPRDTELNSPDESQRLTVLEDILKKDFLEEKYWSTEVALQEQPGYLYHDIDAYFCF